MTRNPNLDPHVHQPCAKCGGCLWPTCPDDDLHLCTCEGSVWSGRVVKVWSGSGAATPTEKRE